MDIRTYIKNNFKDSNIDDIRSSIENSIKENEELVLPGLGVFFETIWINSSDLDRNNLINIIKKNL